MVPTNRACPDCDAPQGSADEPLNGPLGVNRREFLWTVGATAGAAVASSVLPGRVLAANAAKSEPESVVKVLFESLTRSRRRPSASTGTTRTRSAACCGRTSPTTGTSPSRTIDSDFYTKDQQELIRDDLRGHLQPDWHERIDKQLEGRRRAASATQQNIAIFGKPGDGKFEFVMTGRHLTLRCDGNTAEHVAFGGPIFYGHAASGFNEKAGPPRQRLLAPGRRRPTRSTRCSTASSASRPWSPKPPDEPTVGFRGTDGKFPGIPVAELSQRPEGAACRRCCRS